MSEPNEETLRLMKLIAEDPIAGMDEIVYSTPVTERVVKKIQRGCIARVRGNDCMHNVVYSDDAHERLGYEEIIELQKKYNFEWVHRDQGKAPNTSN
jgi:hypothetical protein